MASKGHILIVEDDENLRLALEDNLDDEGYAVTSAGDGKSALKTLAKGDVEVVILDIMLPDIDGYEVCRQIREKGYPVRVLMLTARTLESDLVTGFDAGADDYLSKPYRLRELLARVGALMRRSVVDSSGGGDAAPDRMAFGKFEIDFAARLLRDANGNEVQLTRTEFDLTACLLRNAGKAMSREDILAAAWDPDIVVDPRTVDNFVSNVKRKLDWSKTDAWRIKTVRGVGYRFELDESS
jgi:DNA-binding response OmpR family regulator